MMAATTVVTATSYTSVMTSSHASTMVSTDPANLVMALCMDVNSAMRSADMCVFRHVNMGTPEDSLVYVNVSVGVNTATMHTTAMETWLLRVPSSVIIPHLRSVPWPISIPRVDRCDPAVTWSHHCSHHHAHRHTSNESRDNTRRTLLLNDNDLHLSINHLLLSLGHPSLQEDVHLLHL